MKYGLKTAFCTLVMSGAIVAVSGSVSHLAMFSGNDAADVTDTVKKKTVNDAPATEGSIIDQVVWVVGDEAILKSDVEAMRMQGEMEGMKWNGDPDCIIPEQLAVQKLFLHQAALDSIEVTEAEIAQNVDQQINYWISNAGSREKLEEWKKMTIKQMME